MAGKITGGGRRSAAPKGAGHGGNGRVLTSVDNMSPEDKAKAAEAQRKEREEAEAIQLMSVVSRVKAQQAKVDEARAVLKVQTDVLGDIFRAAKAQSKDFERGRIMELVKDSSPSERRNVQQNEATRARFRRLMGLPVGDVSQEELDLMARLPEVERDGQYWQAVGYTAGVSGDQRDPPVECVKAGHDNRYDAGWKDGQTILAANMAKASAAKAPKPAAAPEETSDQRKARERKEAAAAKAGLEKLGQDKPPETAAEVGARAAADFAADQAAAGEKAANDFEADPAGEIV